MRMAVRHTHGTIGRQSQHEAPHARTDHVKRTYMDPSPRGAAAASLRLGTPRPTAATSALPLPSRHAAAARCLVPGRTGLLPTGRGRPLAGEG